MAADNNTIDALVTANPEALASALKEILDYITPLVENNPDAKWERCCPFDILGGSHDVTWKEGQDNGEIYAARKIQTLLNESLGK
jgi:hypothetical protein